MKLEKIQLNAKGHERFLFQTKRSEMSILSALLAHTVRHTPPHETTLRFRAQCKAMLQAIDKTLKAPTDQQSPTIP